MNDWTDAKKRKEQVALVRLQTEIGEASMRESDRDIKDQLDIAWRAMDRAERFLMLGGN